MSHGKFSSFLPFIFHLSIGPQSTYTKPIMLCCYLQLILCLFHIIHLCLYISSPCDFIIHLLNLFSVHFYYSSISLNLCFKGVSVFLLLFGLQKTNFLVILLTVFLQSVPQPAPVPLPLDSLGFV